MIGQSDHVRELKAKGDQQAITAARAYVEAVATEAIKLRQKVEQSTVKQIKVEQNPEQNPSPVRIRH